MQVVDAVTKCNKNNSHDLTIMVSKKSKDSAKRTTKLRNKPDYVQLVNTNGAVQAITFDLLNAPRPEKNYPAEFCCLRKSPNGNYHFVFSDYNEATNQPSHSVYVKFSDISLVNLWENSKDYIENTIKMVEKIYPEHVATEYKDVSISDNIQTFSSNVAFIGNQEANVLFVFYSLDAMMISAINQQKTQSRKDWIDPVLNVSTSLRSAYQLLRDLRENANKILGLKEAYSKFKENKLIEG